VGNAKENLAFTNVKSRPDGINARIERQCSRRGTAFQTVDDIPTSPLMGDRRPRETDDVEERARSQGPRVIVSPWAILLGCKELHRKTMARGLITRLPDPSLDLDDDNPNDQPVIIKGEPPSETIIRERR
jgi:hypothetical protein